MASSFSSFFLPPSFWWKPSWRQIESSWIPTLPSSFPSLAYSISTWQKLHKDLKRSAAALTQFPPFLLWNISWGHTTRRCLRWLSLNFFPSLLLSSFLLPLIQLSIPRDSAIIESTAVSCLLRSQLFLLLYFILTLFMSAPSASSFKVQARNVSYPGTVLCFCPERYTLVLFTLRLLWYWPRFRA